MSVLHDANGEILNSKWLERWMQHPFNILQYYQPPDQSTQSFGSGIQIPDVLRTQFQQFGSLYEEPFEHLMGDQKFGSKMQG